MGIGRANHDDAVERVLKALGRVEAPEGLEARVAAGLEPQAFALRSAGSAVATRVWWRGAACGVAASVLVVGVVMMAGHFMRRDEVAVRRVTPSHVAVVAVAAQEERREPCASSKAPRVAVAGRAQRREGVRIETVERSQPVAEKPEPSLTAEERGLVRLVKVGDVKELASLNPEVRERLEAEDAAQFERFFAEPAKPAMTEPAATGSTVTEPKIEGSDEGEGR